jgi:hypothetical protein
MKKIFLATGIMMVAAATFAQTGIVEARKETRIENKENRKELREERRLQNSNEVSDLTKDQFAADFHNAKNPLYSREQNFDVVAFTTGKNKKLRAYYDIDSKLVGTTQRKQYADLPENAQRRIQKQYAGYTPTVAIKFDDNQDNDMDMILYGTSFDDADNYFVELVKDSKKVVVKVNMAGDISYFTELK